ncbi:hypothetical protein [Phenylobacterium sp.]|jgi:pyocin large subunit-like protein|uniref:hypothetical protein n=1 Tax=Phenylobacterium sp. TaxID=1871053 RepID=UPI0037C870E2
MAGMRMVLLAAAAGLFLAGCDNGPSAVSQKQAAGTQMATNSQSFTSDAGRGGDEADAPQVDRRNDAVRLVDGKPMWSASRRYSAEENAERAFARNGADFGADSVGEFVQTAHNFVANPPRGTLTYARRNGDRLMYDPKGNVFAVASKAGAPRTMFKPDDGMAYWEEQKARESRRQTAGANRERAGREDS